MADEKSFLTAFCRACQAPRYRSIKPLGRKDESRPELFKAVDPEAPEPTEGPAECFICHDRLVFLADSKLPPLAKTEPVRRASNEPTAPELFQGSDDDFSLVPQSAPPVTPLPTTVEVLFELGPGEELKSSYDTPNSILMVTNKRIVRVGKG